MGLGIYIHVPFCRQKCPYCDFYSLEYQPEAAAGYVHAVLRNLEYYGRQSGGAQVDSIYFGGGTPSLLPAESFAQILEGIAKAFTLASPEITLEANPGTVSLESLKALHHAGFNRISFGVQSLCDSELKKLGRLHDRETAVKAIEDAANLGFHNISADLMLGIIGQDLYSLDKSIAELSMLPLTHISAYILKTEPGTAYDRPEIRSNLPDEDTTADLYLRAAESLSARGFFQYEISNFCKEGFECRHNLHYWRCEEYIGIGPAAHSYFGGRRFAVPRSLEAFLAAEVQPVEVTDENPGGFEEFAMLRLRLMEGLALSDCKTAFGIEPQEILQKCRILEKQGLLKTQGERILLTPSGCLVSNKIIGALIL